MELVSDESKSLEDFTEFLYGGLEGYVATATKTKTADGVSFSRQSFKWPEQRAELLGWIKTTSSEVDVYVAPAIFASPSGKKEDFKASNVVWAEFDGHLPDSDAMGTIPSPSLRVRSSGAVNEHWYWKLDSVCNDASEIENINRALTYQLGADTSGWDCNQILRPPNTLNHKYETPALVSILHYDESTFSPVGLDVLPAYDVNTIHALEAAEIPDVQSVIFKYQWPDHVSEFFRSKVEDGADRSAMLMRLGYDLAEMGLTDTEMFSVLRNADDRWGKFRERTDRIRRLSDLIARARAKYPTEIQIGEDVVPLYGVMSLLQTEVEISWIIEGLLQEQGYMLLTGPSGVGKTQFSLRVAMAIALGRDFLDFKISRPCRILFASLEMGHADIKYFLSIMCAGMAHEDMLLLEENLIIAPVGEAIFLDSHAGQVQIKDIITSCNVEGIMIDSMGSATSGDLSQEAPVKSIMNFNDRLRKELGIWTWYIHHNRKANGDNKKPNKLADVYGNQYLVNRATSVYCLWPSGKNIEVIPLKQRLAATNDPWLITRHDNIQFKKATGVHVLQNKEPGLNLDEDEPNQVGDF